LTRRWPGSSTSKQEKDGLDVLAGHLPLTPSPASRRSPEPEFLPAIALVRPSTSRSPTKATSCGRIQAAPAGRVHGRAQIGGEIGRLANEYAPPVSATITHPPGHPAFHWLTIEKLPRFASTAFTRRSASTTDFRLPATRRRNCHEPGPARTASSGARSCRRATLGPAGSADMFRDGGQGVLQTCPAQVQEAASPACPAPTPATSPQINDVATFGVIHPARRARRGLGVDGRRGGLSSHPALTARRTCASFVPEEKVQEQVPAIVRGRHAHLPRRRMSSATSARRARPEVSLVQDKGVGVVSATRSRRRARGTRSNTATNIVNTPRRRCNTDHMGVGEQSDGPILRSVAPVPPAGRITGDQDDRRRPTSQTGFAGRPAEATSASARRQNLLLVNIPQQNVDARRRREAGAGRGWPPQGAACGGESLIRPATGNAVLPNLAVVEDPSQRGAEDPSNTWRTRSSSTSPDHGPASTGLPQRLRPVSRSPTSASPASRPSTNGVQAGTATKPARRRRARRGPPSFGPGDRPQDPRRPFVQPRDRRPLGWATTRANRIDDIDGRPPRLSATFVAPPPSPTSSAQWSPNPRLDPAAAKEGPKVPARACRQPAGRTPQTHETNASDDPTRKTGTGDGFLFGPRTVPVPVFFSSPGMHVRWSGPRLLAGCNHDGAADD